jgi:crossover junction endodeoxyribonuclease RuvC
MIIGVDPGSVSAAFALLDEAGAIVEVGDVPVVDRMVDGSAFARIVERYQPGEAIIELVSAMPGQGVTSTFRFGLGVGILRGVLLAHQWPLHQVTPSKWKKHFSLDRDAEKSRALAIRMWPGCTELGRKKDHGRAEALLLARYHMETRA